MLLIYLCLKGSGSDRFIFLRNYGYVLDIFGKDSVDRMQCRTFLFKDPHAHGTLRDKGLFLSQLFAITFSRIDGIIVSQIVIVQCYLLNVC